MASLLSCLRTTLALGLLAAKSVSAHSWVEELMTIDSNGTMVGDPGYIRGYVSRSMSGFNDDMDNYLVPPNGRAAGNVIYSNDTLCHPSQTSSNYSTEFPMLNVTAGSYIALRYQENGHVSLPDTNPTKPTNRGTVYIYGTTEPSSDELFLDVFEQWNADGTGGNGRGRLLATRNFDDEQCYQINSGTISTARQAEFKKEAENPQGSDLWCQNDIQLPSDLETGSTYTLYWVWSWPTFNKAGSPTDIPTDGYNITTLQYYTSCMDVTVADSSDSTTLGTNEKASSFSASFVQGQDLNNAAILDQLVSGSYQVAGTNTTTDSSTSSSATGTATSSATSHGTATTDGLGGTKTVVVTVTTTESPVYVTVTETVSGDAPESTSTVYSTVTPGATTPTSTVSTLTKTRTATETSFSTSTSTQTVSTASQTTFKTSSKTSSTAHATITYTVSAPTGTGSTTSTLMVEPFIARRVQRIRRQL